MEKSQIFDENHGLNPLENCNFSTLLNQYFYCLERLFFDGQYSETQFSCLFL